MRSRETTNRHFSQNFAAPASAGAERIVGAQRTGIEEIRQGGCRVLVASVFQSARFLTSEAGRQHSLAGLEGNENVGRACAVHDRHRGASVSSLGESRRDVARIARRFNGGNEDGKRIESRRDD